jgi:hypothetical protein
VDPGLLNDYKRIEFNAALQRHSPAIDDAQTNRSRSFRITSECDHDISVLEGNNRRGTARTKAGMRKDFRRLFVGNHRTDPRQPVREIRNNESSVNLAGRMVLERMVRAYKAHGVPPACGAFLENDEP